MATFLRRMLLVLLTSGVTIDEARGGTIATASAGKGRRPQPRFWSKHIMN